MNYKQKMVVMLLLWGVMMVIGASVSLNEQAWYAITTILLSGTIVFGGKKILNKFQERNNI